MTAAPTVADGRTWVARFCEDPKWDAHAFSGSVLGLDTPCFEEMVLHGPVLLTILVLGGVRAYQLLTSSVPVDPAQRASCRYRTGYYFRALVSLVNALCPLLMLNVLLATRTAADFEVVSMSAQVVPVS